VHWIHQGQGWKEYGNEFSDAMKYCEFFLVAEHLLASQEGPSFMELVSWLVH
jgi:hypothetical protein